MSGIVLPVMAWRAFAADRDDLLELHWPPAALRQLVWMGWLDIASTVALLAILARLWPDHRREWSYKIAAIFAAAQITALTSLAQWNLFAPAML